MKNIATSRKNKHCGGVFLGLFDVIGGILAWYRSTHTDCKQQHFPTRKQTQNPPIKTNFNSASAYLPWLLSSHAFFF